MTKNFMVLAISLFILVVAISIAGCSEGYDRNRMDKTMDVLLKAIQKKDTEGIKQLFSKGVREEVGDEKLEKGVEYLYSVFEGDIVSKERSSDTPKRVMDHGKEQRVLTYVYTVKTTSDIYRIRFISHTEDEITPDFKGMFNLWIRKESEINYGIVKNEFMGIYVPRAIDKSERGIPHEYKTEYGTFTVPSGYYKDDTVSTYEKYYFTVESVVMNDAIYDCFSVSFNSCEFDLNMLESFQDYVLGTLDESLHRYRDPYGDSYVAGVDYAIEKNLEGETVQGYPLFKYTIKGGSGNALVDTYYYVVGDKKYMLVHQYFYTTGIRDEENSMTTAVESLVDSFVWSD